MRNATRYKLCSMNLDRTYLRRVAATRNFESIVPENMTSKLEKLIEKVETELKNRKTSREFDNVAEFLADLKK